MTQKIRANNKNGFQIRILHRKKHRIKEKNILFYMTLKDNITPQNYQVYCVCHPLLNQIFFSIL